MFSQLLTAKPPEKMSCFTKEQKNKIQSKPTNKKRQNTKKKPQLNSQAGSMQDFAGAITARYSVNVNCLAKIAYSGWMRLDNWVCLSGYIFEG